MLHSVGVEFEVRPSNVDESTQLSGFLEAPAELAEKWAVLKASSVSNHNPSQWILGADTIVVLDGRIFGKPSNPEEAVRMLDMLGGRVHDVITGICLIRPGGRVRRTGSVTTLVHFKTVSIREIEAYVRTGEPMDKAGAYGIQGIGAFLVSSIEGSYSNVVGLPLCETLDWLMDENVIELE